MASLSASPPRVAIIGATARAAAQSAVRAGFDVTSADLFADLDLQQAGPATRVERYPDQFEQWLRDANADAWVYTGGLENYPDLLDRLAGIKPLWGNDGQTVRRVRDPLLLQRALGEARQLYPETLGSSEGLPRDGSWLCKAGGSGGFGVWELTSDASAARAAAAGAVYQRQLKPSEGEPAAALLLLSDRETELVGVTKQLIGEAFGAKPFHYAGSEGPIDVSPAIQRQLVHAGELLRGRFGLRGLAGVDLWLGPESATVIEVNPRYPASAEVIERSQGRLLIAEHARCFGAAQQPRQPPSEAPPGRRRSAKKQILYFRGNVLPPKAIRRWALGLASPEVAIADIPAGDAPITAGQPVCTVIGWSGEAFESVVAEARTRFGC